MSTIFEKIISGEMPAHKIYEDEQVYAMLDIDPLADGHVLLIPKQPIDLLWDVDDRTYQYLWTVAKKLAQHMQTILQPKRVGVVVEGFGVPHAHIHLVPLYDEKVLSHPHNHPVHKTNEELNQIAQKLAIKQLNA
ncbi:MAG: HIT family protein [Candidatus Saccharibacteria bacterium]|nr:HIT family protein [Candidatus Saccharibacteria bacterium]